MVSAQSVEEQLKRLSFNVHAWGRTEVSELPNILLPDEEIYEVVNGIYEGGFALLVATNIRVILIDKKPLKYLTVEDLRFDMINEIDYSHRLFGAQISISTGSKNLKFRSYNQPRLRKLINHVQHCMAETKRSQNDHQQGQNQHLQQINEQLQAYLLAQHETQQKLNERLEQAQSQGAQVEPLAPQIINPSPELTDYLYAQSLLRKHDIEPQQAQIAVAPPAPAPQKPITNNDLTEMYDEGRREVFGSQMTLVEPSVAPQSQQSVNNNQTTWTTYNPLELNPLRIAYSKLPMALRNRKFGRPSFHAHSQSVGNAVMQPLQPLMPTQSQQDPAALSASA